MEPNLNNSIGHDALRVWLDFWELTGARRLDIVKRTPSGGDPAKMIPPQITESTLSAVPAILVEDDAGSTLDRAGELDLRSIKIELIDTVHDEDRIRMGGIDYEIDAIEERDMGSFAVWIVQAHRIE